MKRLLILSLFPMASLQAEPSSVLAKIGDLEIQSSEIREVLAGLDAGQQNNAAKDPAAISQYVRALLVQRLLLKQAAEKKWDQEPAVIAKLVRARELALTESFLENESAVTAGYPNDEELAKAYEFAKPKLLVPRSFRLAQIFIASDKAKLDAAQKQLGAKAADFATIAQSLSEETVSANKGGEIGWLTQEQIQPEILEKLPKLTVGATSEAIKLKDGWHIIKLLDVRESYTPTLEQIKPQLTARLREERAQLNRQDYVAKLMKENPVAINEIELARISKQP